MNPFDVTYDAREFSCSLCDASLCLYWNTEYGEPIDGEYDIKCPTCTHEFRINVETRTRTKLVTV